MAEAAKQSVELLQELVDQKEQQLQTRNEQIEEMQLRRKEEIGFHKQEVNDLNNELVMLKAQVAEKKYGSATMNLYSCAAVSSSCELEVKRRDAQQQCHGI